MGRTPAESLFSVHTVETSRARARVASRADREGQSEIRRRREEERQDRRATEHFRGRGFDLSGFELPPSTPGEESFRHSGWAPQRKRIRAALERTGATPAALMAWDSCGSAAWVMRHKETGDYRLASNCCHHRLCLPCAAARSRLISGNVKRALTGRYYLHVVLTLRHSPQPLAQQIDRLYRCFRRLRTKPIWKRRVGGGAAFCEITRNDQAATWHPHLHVLVEARFIPHQDWLERTAGGYVRRPGLSSTWAAVTGGSDVVWLTRVTDRDAAAREVAKYVTKPLSPSLFRDDDALDEFVTAIKGRRLCLTFGSWFKIRLSERTAKFDPAEWDRVCTLDDLAGRAEAGELAAVHLLRILAEVLPCGARAPPAGTSLFGSRGPHPAPCVRPT